MLNLKRDFFSAPRRQLRLGALLIAIAGLNACSIGRFRSAELPVSTAEHCDRSGALRVSMLDVGQGTALLIQCPDGVTQALIDSGNSNINYPHAEEKFRTAFFEKMGSDRELELAIATHPDLDHIAGFAGLMRDARNGQFRIGTYVDNGAKRVDHPIDEEIREAANVVGTRYLNAPRDAVRRLTLCPAVTGQSEEVAIDFFYPTGPLREQLQCEGNFNGCSLINRFSFRGHVFISEADRSVDDEALLSDAELAQLDGDILFVGHHGSGSSSIRFLKAVSPDIALLSTGTPKEAMSTLWGFPGSDVVDRLVSVLPTPKTERENAALETRRIDNFVEHAGWDTTEIPVNLISTAVDGTADLYVSTAGICVARQKSPTALHFGQS